jgi:hypothetical protein
MMHTRNFLTTAACLQDNDKNNDKDNNDKEMGQEV